MLLPVRTGSGEKEAEQDYGYGRAMSAYTRSLRERTRVIRGWEADWAPTAPIWTHRRPGIRESANRFISPV